MNLLKVFLLLILVYIVYEDFRFRAISLYSIVVFFLVAVAYSFSLQELKPAIQSVCLNVLIMAFELAMTWMYFAVIKKQGKNFINKTIGLGDLLFYIPVLFLFSPLNFICIHIATLVVILAVFALYTVVIKPVKTIPLAGAHSITLILIISATWVYAPAMLYDDMMMADFLYSLSI